MLPPVAPPLDKKRIAASPWPVNSRPATIARTCTVSGNARYPRLSTPYVRCPRLIEKRTSRPSAMALYRAPRIWLNIVRTVSRYWAESRKRSKATGIKPTSKARMANTTNNSTNVKPRSRRMGNPAVVSGCFQGVLRMSAFSPSPPGAPSAPREMISMLPPLLA